HTHTHADTCTTTVIRTHTPEHSQTCTMHICTHTHTHTRSSHKHAYMHTLIFCIQAPKIDAIYRNLAVVTWNPPNPNPVISHISFHLQPTHRHSTVCHCPLHVDIHSTICHLPLHVDRH